jgi:DNA helicase-2/ATP-dependent DNA helicase PcrA
VVAEGTLAVPQTGELQVLTLHGSKGAEYDAVWIPGMGYGERSSSSWFPWMPADTYVMDVEGLKAERALRLGPDTALPPESMLVEEAKAAAIAERLRLLYVGITRAQRALHLSAHRSIRRQDSLPRHIAYLAALCQPREAVR